uniref:Uncharacterized protein n=1 Tax=Trypanosoma vivax (strain Y486) TaxID=1055687 RepID=G0TZV1_TRYVY|nr:hypothetical protein, unlikely [Trypanosoma vivax Y486]
MSVLQINATSRNAPPMHFPFCDDNTQFGDLSSSPPTPTPATLCSGKIFLHISVPIFYWKQPTKSTALLGDLEKLSTFPVGKSHSATQRTALGRLYCADLHTLSIKRGCARPRGGQN